MSSKMNIYGLEERERETKTNVLNGDILLITTSEKNKYLAQAIKEKREDGIEVLKLIVLNTGLMYNIPLKDKLIVTTGNEYISEKFTNVFIEGKCDIDIYVRNIKR